MNPARLGHLVEYQVIEGLNTIPGIRAWHSTKEQDRYEGWDAAVEILRVITVRVDFTISTRRFEEKNGSEMHINGHIIPILLDARTSPEEMAQQTLRQIVCTLPRRLVKDLLALL